PPELDAAGGAARRKRRRHPNRVCDPGRRPAMYDRPRWLPASVTLADLIAIRRGEPMPSAALAPPPPPAPPSPAPPSP
ncbi:MAG TPA: hypothetical protein VFP84_37380, partial [Kofleriaceae bacterium]|nr:hypothetical protein [Kofleriaceae bacterium]